MGGPNREARDLPRAGVEPAGITRPNEEEAEVEEGVETAAGAGAGSGEVALELRRRCNAMRWCECCNS